MADEVGKWLPLGLADGIEDNIKPVSKAMQSLEFYKQQMLLAIQA